MSQEDADRLVEDLDTNQDLHDEIAAVQDQTLEVARQHGYDVSRDEVRAAVQKKHGGKPPKPPKGGGAHPWVCLFSEAPGR